MIKYRKPKQPRSLGRQKKKSEEQDQRKVIVIVQADQGMHSKFMNLSTMISKAGVYSLMTPLNYMRGQFEVSVAELDRFRSLARAEGLEVVEEM